MLYQESFGVKKRLKRAQLSVITALMWNPPKLNSFTHSNSNKNFHTQKTLSCIKEVMRRNLKNDILLRFISVFRLYGLGRKKKEKKKLFFVHLRGERNGCTTIQWWIYIQRSPSTNACRKIKKNEFFENPLGIHSLFRFFGFCFFYFCMIQKIYSFKYASNAVHIHIHKKILYGEIWDQKA